MTIKQKIIFILWLAARTSGSSEWRILDDVGLISETFDVPDQMVLQREITKPARLLITNNHTVFKEGAHYQSIVLDWRRILPEVCTSKVNHSEINIYKEMIDLLLHDNAKPVIILYSGNLPQKLAPLGGWTNPIIVQYFANYARQVFKIFGDTVDQWITFHDPRAICETFDGLIGDEFPSGMEYLCVHNILKAHAEVYHIYERGFRNVQHGDISIAFNVRWMEPLDTFSLEDTRAAEQRMQFEFGIYAHPLINIDYPPMVKDRIAKRSVEEGFEHSRLPTFTHAERSRISGSYDYITLYYKGALEITSSVDEEGHEPHIEGDAGGQLSEAKKFMWKYGRNKLLDWILTSTRD